MERVKTGHLDDLSLLYDRYQSQLMGFFVGMTQDREQSADLVQNVFYRILKYRAQFKGGQFKTWMFHIARNVHRDSYKRKKITMTGSLEDYKEIIADHFESDGNLYRNEQLSLLNKAMNALTEDKREILLLSKYQEKNYKEIGDILGCNEGAVKVRVFRALNDLRSLYMQYQNETV